MRTCNEMPSFWAASAFDLDSRRVRRSSRDSAASALLWSVHLCRPCRGVTHSLRGLLGMRTFFISRNRLIVNRLQVLSPGAVPVGAVALRADCAFLVFTRDPVMPAAQALWNLNSHHTHSIDIGNYPANRLRTNDL